MGANQRRKGIIGELEAARLLTEHGITARRNLRETRAGEGRDLVLEVPLAVQVKRGRRPNPLRALDEAVQGAVEGEVPVALIREDRGDWVVVARADDVLPMVAAWYALIRDGAGR